MFLSGEKVGKAESKREKSDLERVKGREGERE